MQLSGHERAFRAILADFIAGELCAEKIFSRLATLPVIYAIVNDN